GALRLMLGYVPQEGFLFSRSIAENITLGREDADAARVREAAVAAGVADETDGFLAGFDTVVGERGLTLSGGQRQRVALARALVGRPPILVLDDPFASVDASKEEEIVGNLRALAQGRTVLLMTHRLRAAQLADRVVVLDAGRVVEQGRLAGSHVDRGPLRRRPRPPLRAALARGLSDEPHRPAGDSRSARGALRPPPAPRGRVLRPEPRGAADDARPGRRGGGERGVHERALRR